jgi:hypothetical protein
MWTSLRYFNFGITCEVVVQKTHLSKVESLAQPLAFPSCFASFMKFICFQVFQVCSLFLQLVWGMHSPKLECIRFWLEKNRLKFESLRFCFTRSREFVCWIVVGVAIGVGLAIWCFLNLLFDQQIWCFWFFLVKNSFVNWTQIGPIPRNLKREKW